jgi:hypothetical protein
MKQVLFCVDQSVLKDLIKINFRHSQFIQPIITETIDEATALFDLTQDIDVIVTQTSVKGSSAATEIPQWIDQNGPRPYQLVVIGEDPKLPRQYDLYPMDKIRDIFNMLREKYGGAEEEDVSQDNCVSMPSHLFLHFSALPFDIFLKVQQGSEAKYIKRFNASEVLDHEAVNKYISRGVNDFYLEREYLKDFSRLLIQQVFNSLKDMVKSLGLKPQVVKLCEISMQNVQKRLNDESPFKSFLESLKSNQKLSFHFAFVQLTSLLCSQYVEHTDWPKKQKDDLIEKLIFSTYFCDMNVTSDEMLMARSEEQLSKFNSHDMEVINTHAFKTADYIKKYPGAPQEVDKIILQHHGSVNGHGVNKYPWSGTLLSSQILFYSQDLALRILSAHGKKLKDVLNEFAEEFKDSPQPDIINKFLKSFNQEVAINN